MIRKISTQDVVSKKSEEHDSNRSERDYLIERLTRKHPAPSVVESPAKNTKRSQRHRRKFSFNFSAFKFGKKWFWLSLPFIFILIILIALQFMVSATVKVKPKSVVVPIDAKLIASNGATTSPDIIAYQVITLNSTASETVVATGTVPTPAQKASGQITIFNNYSGATQTLVKNTRFETADGLIYRIQNTIKVPGTTVSGGKIVAGSITVPVVADQIGSSYNIDVSDFTIPGFKTDAARYSKIFARSATAMTGGSDGNAFGVSDATRQSSITDLDTQLQSNLLSQVQAQETVDSVIFDGASKISFQHLPDTAGTDSQHVIIHEQGTISSLVFDKKTLGTLLLSDAVASVGNNAEIHGLESLHFIAAVSSTTAIWQTKPFTFTLNGQVGVIGVVNTDQLLKDLQGIPRSGLDKVLSNYPTIDQATAKIKPFWKSTFPAKASEINIEVAN